MALTALVALALIAWALAPALFRMVERPPGDGQTIESYAFDLSQRDEGAIMEPATLYRDMIPVLDHPEILDPPAIAEVNDGRRKYLISSDLVIGVELDGEARAWPLSILNVHEVINDQVGDTPVSVTWHWPSGTTRVFDRRLAGTEQLLGVSGLVYGGNLLLYPRRADGETGGEQLISQALGRSVTGPPLELDAIPHEVVPWSNWVARHPETSVAAGRPDFKQRYKKGKPDHWFASEELIFTTPPPSAGPPPKTHLLLLRSPEGVSLLAIDDLVEASDATGRITVDHAGMPLEIQTTARPATARVIDPPEGLESMRILWISAHALFPQAGVPEV
ncbi:MAG: DUF3179 domain-containing protein [Phycisphaerales bacterium]|nr:DUF3179 domain-containing protein [Phycisphaerales bacterium]